MPIAVAHYDRILAEAAENVGGVLIPQSGAGERRLGVFRLASSAVASAVEVQRKLQATDWPEDVAPRVRLALYSGEADVRDGIYYGTAVNRCARLRALAAPGQSLMAESVRALVRSAIPVGVTLRDLGDTS